MKRHSNDDVQFLLSKEKLKKSAMRHRKVSLGSKVDAIGR